MCVCVCVCVRAHVCMFKSEGCTVRRPGLPSGFSLVSVCLLESSELFAGSASPLIPVPSPAHAHTCSESFFQQSFCSSQTSIFSFFYWSVVDLHCCVSFCCIAKWLSYGCIFFFIFFPLWFFTEYWICSLCCMVRPCLFLSPSANTKLKAFKDRSFLPIVHLPKAPA